MRTDSKKATPKKAAAKNATPKKAATKKAAAKKAARRPTARKLSTPKTPAKPGSASAMIDARILELGDWRGEKLAQIRALIKDTVPDVIEEWKWRGTPVWERRGILCTGETYKSVVKMTFAKGASLPDPSKLFNSSLDGNVRRAIDLREGDALNKKALAALIRAAVALNELARSK